MQMSVSAKTWKFMRLNIELIKKTHKKGTELVVQPAGRRLPAGTTDNQYLMTINNQLTKLPCPCARCCQGRIHPKNSALCGARCREAQRGRRGRGEMQDSNANSALAGIFCPSQNSCQHWRDAEVGIKGDCASRGEQWETKRLFISLGVLVTVPSIWALFFVGFIISWLMFEQGFLHGSRGFVVGLGVH